MRQKDKEQQQLSREGQKQKVRIKALEEEIGKMRG